jgi:hypothetical protein
MMSKINAVIAACLLLVAIAPAHADSRNLVTLTNLDNFSTAVGLQEIGGNCRFFGLLEKNEAGEYFVTLERKTCPDQTEETIKATAWIGQFPELPYCAGKVGCLRGLPAGASLPVNE